MKVIVYVNINGDYKITCDGKTVVNCIKPVCQFNDLLKNLFVDQITVDIFDSKDEIVEDNTYSQTDKQETKKEKNKYEPVGEVEQPEIGDLIYVECIQGILKNVFGGVATVSNVVEDNDNIMICIDEMPGLFVNWSDLRYKQNDFKNKYGYKPAMFI